MTDTSQPLPDPLRAWREATGGDAAASGDADRNEGPERRPTRLFVLAGGVCALTLLLALAATRAAPSEVVAAAPLPTPVTAASTAPLTAPPPVVPTAEAPVPPAAAASAVLAVRADAADGTYVDTAVVDGAVLTSGTLVVTVRALLLHRVGRGWDSGSTVRYAVPVDPSDGSVLAPAWQLAAEQPKRSRLAWAPAREAALAAAAAATLRDAGYRLEGDPAVRRSPDVQGVISVSVEAIGPADDVARRHEVWLTADASAVLGADGPAATTLPVPQS